MSSFSFLINYFIIYFEENKKQNNFMQLKNCFVSCAVIFRKINYFSEDIFR